MIVQEKLSPQDFYNSFKFQNVSTIEHNFIYVAPKN